MKKMDRRAMKIMEDMSAPGNLPTESKRVKYPRDMSEMDYNYPDNVEEMYTKEMDNRRKVKKHMSEDMF